jgi:hypothetical protein
MMTGGKMTPEERSRAESVRYAQNYADSRQNRY